MKTTLRLKERKGRFSCLIKVNADSNLLNRYLDSLKIDFIDRVRDGSLYGKENFTFDLKLRGSAHNNRLHKERDNLAKVFIHLRGQKFLFSTISGSFVKGDFTKGYGEGRIVEKEASGPSMLQRSLEYCYLYNFSARIHAAVIETKGRVFLISGHSGAGKSTLSGLLKKSYKVLHDDVCFTFSRQKRSYIVSLTPDKSGQYNFTKPKPCCSIFFIEQHRGQKSEIRALSKKEAFKRIIFLSEFPSYECDMQEKARMENLETLINQSKCFSLINGKGLPGNPGRLESLLSPALA